MALSEREQGLIAQIKEMQALGFSKTRESLLPQIYTAVYGRLYNRCSACEESAYNTLIRWAKKRGLETIKTNNMGSYKFKHEHRNKRAIFLHMGRRYVVTADNLTDETALVLLSISKYQDWIEPIGENNVPTVDIAKAEIPAEPVIMDVTNILADDKGAKVPNELPSVASTLTGQAIDGPKQKGKPGPKPKVK